MDETEIVNRCKKGDMKAFSHIYSSYAKRIYDYIYYKTFHRETAEDITSHTFMKALENITGFDPGQGNISSWLYAIARNAVTDHYRKAKKSVNIDDIWDLAGNDDPEVDAINQEAFDTIQDFLKSLTPDKRSIIIMRVWQDMSYKEISRIMGKTEAQCKMTFYRAIEKMKQQIPAQILLIFLLRL
jgi:RNA polymerase sigma-70 factor (ECF subfamily)